MKRIGGVACIFIAEVIVALQLLARQDPQAGLSPQKQPAPIVIDYPADESIFPPDFSAPTFLWRDGESKATKWVIDVAFSDGSAAIQVKSPGERHSGWSNYNSLQFTATKRTSSGVSFLVAYTFSKNLASGDDGTGYYSYGQTIYNRKLDYGVASLNVPQNLRVTWIYDLPFGPQGHWLKGGPLSYILGGWTVSGINNWRSGAPLSISNSSGPDTSALNNNGFYVDTLLGRDQQISGSKPGNPDRGLGSPFLNPAAWGPVPVTENNVATRLPTGVKWQPNLRGFMQSGEQLSIIKRTRLPFREGNNFEIRADIVNPMNRTRLTDPNTDISDPSTFGRVFGKQNVLGTARTIQLGVRITF